VVPTRRKPRRVGQPISWWCIRKTPECVASSHAANGRPFSPMRTLDSRSLHFADHRFAMIRSGRDDRAEKI
jgi:hypothetical protein